MKPVLSGSYKYVYFLEDDSIFLVDPWEDLISPYILMEEGIEWVPGTIAIGEDLEEMEIDIGEYSSNTWFLVDSSFPREMTLDVKLGRRVS